MCGGRGRQMDSERVAGEGEGAECTHSFNSASFDLQEIGIEIM